MQEFWVVHFWKHYLYRVSINLYISFDCAFQSSVRIILSNCDIYLKIYPKFSAVHAASRSLISDIPWKGHFENKISHYWVLPAFTVSNKLLLSDEKLIVTFLWLYQVIKCSHVLFKGKQNKSKTYINRLEICKLKLNYVK